MQAIDIQRMDMKEIIRNKEVTLNILIFLKK
jgi:hypothetical protein